MKQTLIPFLMAVIGLVGVPTVQAQSLGFGASTSDVAVGETITTDLVVDTKGTQIVAMDAEILYDPLMVEVINISTTNLFADYPLAAYDNTTGEIKVSGVVPSATRQYSGTGTFATVTWRALAPGTAIVQYFYEPGGTTDSNLVTLQATEALTSVGTLSLNVTGTGTTQRTATTPTNAPETQFVEEEAVAPVGGRQSVTDQAVVEEEPSQDNFIQKVIKSFTGLFGGSSNDTTNEVDTASTGDVQRQTEVQVNDEVQTAEGLTEEDLYGPITQKEPKRQISRGQEPVTGDQVVVTTTPTDSQEADAASEDNSGMISAVLLGLVILAMIIGLFLAKKAKKNKQMPPQNTTDSKDSNNPPSPPPVQV